MTILRELPLRDRKYARNKLNLLLAAFEQLKDRRFEEISVKALCEEVQVSEATFFNYFPKKNDLLLYFAQLWSIEVGWHARRVAAESGLAALEAIFEHMAGKAEEHPRAVSELIVFKARLQSYPEPREVTLAERLTAFPDLPGVENMPSHWLDSILMENLQRAKELGELAESVDLDMVVISLLSLYFGVPLVTALIAPGDIHAMYRQQLDLLWAALGVARSGIAGKE